MSDGPPRLQRRGTNAADAGESVQVETDPFAYLQEALRQPAAGEKQVQGILLRLDCNPKGIVFVVQLPHRVIKLRTAKFEAIQISAFSGDAGSEITCGPRKPPNPVVVCYVPATDPKAKVDGELRSVEFVPGEFKLKAN